VGLFDKLDKPVFLKEFSDTQDQLDQLKDLLKTAPDDIKGQVEQDMKMLSYGIRGEEQIAFELKNSFMPMIILHDLHIEHEGLSAQIDYLVITRKVFIVIECKNLYGNIEVTSNGEFIRTFDYGNKKVRKGIYSPITQNQRHLDLLKKIDLDRRSNFLSKAIAKKYIDDWYKSVVVLANPQTVINMRYAKKDIKDQIIRGDQLVEYIKKLIRLQSNDLPFSDKELYARADRFLSLHTPNTNDYTNKYEMALKESETATTTETAENDSNPCSSENLEDTPLYKALRQYRYEKSREEKVKPYFLYNNAQMEDLIQHMPESLDELKQISGFGDVKCQKYGADIISIIDKHR
jgi:protein required for attachment to host cells